MKQNDNIFLQQIQELLSSESDVKVIGLERNTQAVERYVHVVFCFGQHSVDTMLPYQYKKSGLSLASAEEVATYIVNCKKYFEPATANVWYTNELNKIATKSDFKSILLRILLSSFGNCVTQSAFPQNNNPQKPIQVIKDSGYFIAVLGGNKKRKDITKRQTRYWLLPLPKYASFIYETMTEEFVEKVVRCLRGKNVYENRKTPGLLPDHKFPEIRWGNRPIEENTVDMSDVEIKRKFQLLDTQRNLQKKEVCRNCFQSGHRGSIFGIDFFYEGSEIWDESIPQVGIEAEKGCIGCPWYDLEKWRKELNQRILKHY